MSIEIREERNDGTKFKMAPVAAVVCAVAGWSMCAAWKPDMQLFGILAGGGLGYTAAIFSLKTGFILTAIASCVTWFAWQGIPDGGNHLLRGTSDRVMTLAEKEMEERIKSNGDASKSTIVPKASGRVVEATREAGAEGHVVRRIIDKNAEKMSGENSGGSPVTGSLRNEQP